MTNSEVSQANFVASVYLVGGRSGEWKWLSQHIAPTPIVLNYLKVNDFRSPLLKKSQRFHMRTAKST